jgi:tripartite-type tricarboxylate transporter receptor subunit TctC
MLRFVPILALACAAPASVVAPSALAQSYPTKPIRMIIPLAPGGSADNGGRMIADKLGQALGQAVFVENRSGASTDIGIGALAKAPPDGYTIGIVPVGSVATGILVRKLPYDPIKDLAPISGMTKSGLVLVTSSAKPYKSVAEVVQAAKAKPGDISFGSIGVGSSHHLAGELLQHMAGVKLLHVPYKGSGESNTAVLSGQIDLSISGASGIAPHVRSGKLRALGITGPTRAPNLPDVPTIGETIPGYSAGAGGLSLFASGGTPADIVNRLNGEMKKALDMPDVLKRIVAAGEEPDYTTPEELGRLLALEIRKWTDMVRESGIKLQ